MSHTQSTLLVVLCMYEYVQPICLITEAVFCLVEQDLLIDATYTQVLPYTMPTKVGR